VFTVIQTDRGASNRAIEDRVFAASGLDISFFKYECASEEELIELCSGADALIVAYAPVTERVLDRLPSCVTVAFMATGFNSVDMAAASARGIVVTNVPDYCTAEVADHAMGFLLGLGRNIARLHHSVREGLWEFEAAGKPGRISEQSLGIIGLGRIGSVVARRAAAFGLKMRAFDPYVDEAYMSELGVSKTSLDEVLACDYVSLHCLLTEETRRIVDGDALAAMKPGSFLINTARGACVDTEALTEALASGKLAGAALDVLDPEPLPAGHPLLAMPNVIVTPHAAFLSSASLLEAREKTCLEVVRALRGETPHYVCNPEVLEAGSCRFISFAKMRAAAGENVARDPSPGEEQ
jgi:D-3-phosphoglycerate dehydrogenase / 2-oxoglutarate reductase